jgi:hypothetical protein
VTSEASTLTRRAVLALGSGWLGTQLLGCGGGALVPIAGERVAPEVIDRDPIALLPRDIIAFGSLDLAALFTSPMAADILTLVQGLVPLGPEANFVPQRDTSRVVGGVYAMQGVDFCAVVQGRFDVPAIQRAADVRAATPGGLPVVKSRYFEYDFYTVGNLGFVLLISATALVGNEIGMRRALDRLRSGAALERRVPAWMIELANTQGARFAVACDFGADSVLAAGGPAAPTTALASASTPAPVPASTPAPSSSPATPVVEAAANTLPFLSGLRAVRFVGDFASPGVNLAGSLTYASVDRAEAGAASLRSLSSMSAWLQLFSGISLAPSKIEGRGSDVAVVLPLDLQSARGLLGQASAFVRRA